MLDFDIELTQFESNPNRNILLNKLDFFFFLLLK